MKTKMTGAAIIFAAALLLSPDFVQAQDLHPSRRLSPIGIAKAHAGDAYVKVTYGRPYIRGRRIFGANTDTTDFLVPFGEVWRTGANEATEVTVTSPILFNGEHLEAGTYSIFTEPGPSEWIIHISPSLGLDGTGIFDPVAEEFTPVFDPAEDVLTTRVSPHRLDETVDQFTISLEQADYGQDMLLSWENTGLRIPIRPLD